MTYTFAWITEGRVLKALMPFKFDDALAREFDKDVIAYLDQAQIPICLIVDLRAVKIHPTISTMLSWKQFQHPKFRQAILVGMAASPIVRFATNIIMKVMRVRLTGAATMEDALMLAESLEDSSRNS